MFSTGHLIGWIWKSWSQLFQFCHLISFHCLGCPGFIKCTVRGTEVWVCKCLTWLLMEGGYLPEQRIKFWAVARGCRLNPCTNASKHPDKHTLFKNTFGNSRHYNRPSLRFPSCNTIVTWECHTQDTCTKALVTHSEVTSGGWLYREVDYILEWNDLNHFRVISAYIIRYI